MTPTDFLICGVGRHVSQRNGRGSHELCGIHRLSPILTSPLAEDFVGVLRPGKGPALTAEDIRPRLLSCLLGDRELE